MHSFAGLVKESGFSPERMESQGGKQVAGWGDLSWWRDGWWEAGLGERKCKDALEEPGGKKTGQKLGEGRGRGEKNLSAVLTDWMGDIAGAQKYFLRHVTHRPSL